MPPLGMIHESFGPGGSYGEITGPPVQSSVLPKRLMSGIVSRSMDRTTSAVLPLLMAGVGGSQVIEVKWRDLQSSPTSLKESTILSLVSDINTCKARGVGWFLRIFSGYYAPDFVRADVGSMVWYTNDGALAIGTAAPSDPTKKWKQMPNEIPLWWTSKYCEHYDNMIELLSKEPRLINDTGFCGVSISGPSTQYAEPMVKQFSLKENRDSAVGAGYTQLADEQAFYQGFAAHKLWLSPLRIPSYLAMNDYQTIGSGGGMVVDSTITIRIMEKMVSVLGRMAVLENNSFQYPTTKYPKMYARMLSFRTATPASPTHFQTETLVKHQDTWDAQTTKITSPYATATAAMGRKAGSVEMPTGFQAEDPIRWAAFSVGNASNINKLGWNNCVGLDEYHATPV